MGKKRLLTLKLDGNCDQGFDVEWEIGEDGQIPTKNGKSRLALLPAPELGGACDEWDRSSQGDRITPIHSAITNVRSSVLWVERQEIADRLKALVNGWLDRSPLSRLIQQDLLPNDPPLNRDDEYRVVICTEDKLARKIPWSLWRGWEQFHLLQISLAAPHTERHNRIYQQQVRILAILGDETGINIKKDCEILESYEKSKGAYVKFLPQPTRKELEEQLRDKIGWDILSFSGHSRTEEDNSGRIFINSTDSLRIGELETELTIAIRQRLQIAIFNSCDGLGIADKLASLHIPQVIVMRQPVPDLVAQTFLKDFLEQFSSGTSFYQSVQMARDSLRKIESECPCASWLPTIIQNRLETPPTWQSLGSVSEYPYKCLVDKSSQYQGISKWELSEKIVSISQKLNIRFEDGLLEKILDSVFSNEDRLGLTESILRSLWERQENGWLTHRGYQEFGGIERILVSRAATIFNSLPPDRKTVFKNIFIQLIQFNLHKPISRTASRAEIGEDNWELVEFLIARKIIVLVSKDQIELIHDSLINHWETFEIWIEQNRDFRSRQERLRMTIIQWEKADRDKGSLLRGKALAAATGWIGKYSSRVPSSEKDFVNLSLAKQKRDNQIKAGGFILVLIGIVIALSLFLIQVKEKEQLATKGNISSLTLNAELLLEKQQQSQALVKAEQAVKEIENSGLTDSDISLPAILTLSDILDRINEKKVWSKQTNTVADAVYTQDGRNIISIDRDGRLNTYGLDRDQTENSVGNSESFSKLIASNGGRNIIANRTLNTLKSWQRLLDDKWSKRSNLNTGTEITAMDLSSDGKTLAVAINNKIPRLYSDFIDHPSRSQDLQISEYIHDLKFTPDGKKIITAHNGSVRISTKQGKLLNSYSSDPSQKFLAVAINTSGKTIAVGDNRGLVTILDIDGKLKAKRKISSQEIINLSFQPSQDLVAIATEDRQIKLWNINTGQLRSFSGHTGSVQSVNFSPDGKTLMSTSADGTIRFWNIADKPNPSNPNFNKVEAFSYSINGDRLVAARTDKMIEIVDTKNSQISSLDTESSTIIPVISISKDLRYVATSNSAAETTLWMTDENKNIKFSGYHCAFSPTESILAIAGVGKISIYDINSKLTKNWATKLIASHLSFSPDGSRLIVGSDNGSIESWDLNGKLLPEFKNIDTSTDVKNNRILDIGYSSDGKNISVASSNKSKQGEASIWSSDGKQRIGILNSSVQITSLSFSPDGKILLTGNKKGEVQFWNLKGELLKTIKFSEYEISKVRFKPNSLEFTAIDTGHNMRSYNLDAHRLLDRAKKWQQLTK